MAGRSPFRKGGRAGRPVVIAIAACCLLRTAVLAAAFSFTTVVIDAGHGGKDGGAVWNGLLERELTLDVARRLDGALRAKGLRTVMTRKGDSTVELSDRAAIANRTRSSVFVSIHFNACRDRAAAGIETHYRSARGRGLAGFIQRALDRNVTGANRGLGYADYKVLRETRMSAVLVECGFISNKKEATLCASPAHRQKLAEAIAAGLLAARR